MLFRSEPWAKEVYPKLSNAVAAAKLKHDVPIVNSAFTGSGDDFIGVMRQNTAINAFMQARNSMAGGSGAATIDTFAQTRADEGVVSALGLKISLVGSDSLDNPSAVAP